MSAETPQRPALRHISLSHNNADSQASALRLIFTLFPEWETSEGEVKFTRFTDGITNTLLKATKRRPGLSEKELDDNAVLLRAYGKGTEVLIDREKETSSHLLLSSQNLAPPLLARFQNGLLYRFIQGRPCSSRDLTKPSVWRGVARRLGEWHAVLPVHASAPVNRPGKSEYDIQFSLSRSNPAPSLAEINAITPGKLTPNIWTITQKWIFALPTSTPAQATRKDVLQRELERTVHQLADLPGLGTHGIVLGHCDLLSGNVIIEPKSNPINSPGSPGEDETETVSFIDYEYATPAPAAFDLANHFSEWGGFECDYSALPTRSTRRAFLREYLASYNSHLPSSTSSSGTDDDEAQLDALFMAVDRFRGVPGFYWGVWALIQAAISQIDFDYASYAEVRLGEYWAWRAEMDGTREKEGTKVLEREARWGSE